MTKGQNGVQLKGAIDADGHILEPPDLWERYLEPKYRARALWMASRCGLATQGFQAHSEGWALRTSALALISPTSAEPPLAQ